MGVGSRAFSSFVVGAGEKCEALLLSVHILLGGFYRLESGQSKSIWRQSGEPNLAISGNLEQSPI